MSCQVTEDTQTLCGGYLEITSSMAQHDQTMIKDNNDIQAAQKKCSNEYKYTLIHVNECRANTCDVYKIHVQRQSMYQQEIYINRGITMNHHFNAAQGKSTIFVSPNYAVSKALKILTTFNTFKHMELSIADKEKGMITGFYKK